MGRAAATLLSCAFLLAACSSSSGDDTLESTTPTSPPSTITTTAATTAAPTSAAPDPAADIAYLVDTIHANHPDPFHHQTEAELDERVRSARGAIDAAPGDPDVALVAAALVANLGLGEGHGGVYPWGQAGLSAWELHLYDFDDGIRLVGGDGAGVPLGSRLVAIDGVGVDALVAAVEPLVPHDNHQTIRARLPSYLVFPAVLRGAGFDVADAAILTWELADGSRADHPAPPLETADDFRDRLGLIAAQAPPTLPPSAGGPRYRLHRDEALWFEYVGADAMYVGWNFVLEISAEVDALRERLAAGVPRAVVVDVRNNPGGDIGDGIELVQLLADVERAAPGTVRLVVGRSTFSAATHSVADLLGLVDVTVVGEPTGGSPTSYADARRIELPYSGVLAFIDSNLYEADSGNWEPIAPDVAVAITWADVEAGRDPVLDAALAAP